MVTVGWGGSLMTPEVRITIILLIAVIAAVVTLSVTVTLFLFIVVPCSVPFTCASVVT